MAQVHASRLLSSLASSVNPSHSLVRLVQGLLCSTSRGLVIGVAVVCECEYGYVCIDLFRTDLTLLMDLRRMNGFLSPSSVMGCY